jgi:hypothetical protein
MRVSAIRKLENLKLIEYEYGLNTHTHENNLKYRISGPMLFYYYSVLINLMVSICGLLVVFYPV